MSGEGIDLWLQAQATVNGTTKTRYYRAYMDLCKTLTGTGNEELHIDDTLILKRDGTMQHKHEGDSENFWKFFKPVVAKKDTK